MVADVGPAESNRPFHVVPAAGVPWRSPFGRRHPSGYVDALGADLGRREGTRTLDLLRVKEVPWPLGYPPEMG